MLWPIPKAYSKVLEVNVANVKEDADYLAPPLQVKVDKLYHRHIC